MELFFNSIQAIREKKIYSARLKKPVKVGTKLYSVTDRTYVGIVTGIKHNKVFVNLKKGQKHNMAVTTVSIAKRMAIANPITKQELARESKRIMTQLKNIASGKVSILIPVHKEKVLSNKMISGITDRYKLEGIGFERITNLNPNPKNVTYAFRCRGIMLYPTFEKNNDHTLFFEWECGRTPIKSIEKLKQLKELLT